MKKIIFMALFAATLSACSNENNEVTQETTNLKSLDFSFDVATPKTRMSDDEVTTAIIKTLPSSTSTHPMLRLARMTLHPSR